MENKPTKTAKPAVTKKKVLTGIQKLLAFQKEVGAISKDKKNPFFKSNYFDINQLIEEVKPILNKLELVITQPLETEEGKPVLRTHLIDVASGEMLVVSSALLPEGLDAQKMGAAITYFRRYALQSMLFLQAEDDDGNTASAKKTTKATTKTPDAGPKRDCPYCEKPHTGQYPKCLDCFKREKAGETLTETKIIINEDEPPFE